MAIDTLLIANRGEIACRIIRTARKLGLRTIAVYSKADRNALHTSLADEAMEIGEATASQSYLNIRAILDAANRTGADAIHPGYGFLSENAQFAEAVNEAGLIFVGAPPSAIRAMGDKAEARKLALEAGVPCIPGYEGDQQSEEALLKAANKIGFPLMVKASAGGGGKGMRLVEEAEELQSAIEIARSEAKAAFGSDHLILEKAITSARHVEVQIFADGFGNIVHLGERDCSLQRRHQKVIEESPCPAVSPEIRRAMTVAAIQAARAVEYRGAGTVEFLLGENGDFYFLEMNTRLQVEHPVTEAITGFDLVEWQLKIAAGEPLPVSQEDIEFNGHAIEARLYAEDPTNNFTPAAGRIRHLSFGNGAGIRIDNGVDAGGEVPTFYDPMIAKVIAWGETRDIARKRLEGALASSTLAGIPNNRDFLIELLRLPEFVAGTAFTTTLDETWPAGPQKTAPLDRDWAIAGLLLFLNDQQKWHTSSPTVSEELLGWSSTTPLPVPIDLEQGENKMTALVSAVGRHFNIQINTSSHSFNLEEMQDSLAIIEEGGHRKTIAFHNNSNAITLNLGDRSVEFTRRDLLTSGTHGDNENNMVAPMHGNLVSLAAAPGDKVNEGQIVAIIEAMKMQHQLRAPRAGKVIETYAKEGDQLQSGAVILELDWDDQ